MPLNPNHGRTWLDMPYNAGLQEHVDGVWVETSEQKIIFMDFSGEKHEVA